ncbi:hypothetical protein PR048_022980 [Dryococelus australis]|uniref:Uncharacterized protein n=1 Tax=Dryococelus australis TaxID=614101 RepID=A0ABQ9GSS9_9NEOP|nr:hypothetical protein PR048_022980 [Dryococelus australis]
MDVQHRSTSLRLAQPNRNMFSHVDTWPITEGSFGCRRRIVKSSMAGAAVAERLACSPPTKANRVQSPAGSFPDFRMGKTRRTIPLVGEFSRGCAVSPARSILTSITHIGSQDLAVKSRPNVFTHSPIQIYVVHRATEKNASDREWAIVSGSDISRKDSETRYIYKHCRVVQLFDWLKHVLVGVNCFHTNHEGAVSEIRYPEWLGRMRKQHQQPMECFGVHVVLESFREKPVALAIRLYIGTSLGRRDGQALSSFSPRHVLRVSMPDGPAGMKGRRKREIAEETRRRVASTGEILTYDTAYEEYANTRYHLNIERLQYLSSAPEKLEVGQDLQQPVATVRHPPVRHTFVRLPAERFTTKLLYEAAPQRGPMNHPQLPELKALYRNIPPLFIGRIFSHQRPEHIILLFRKTACRIVAIARPEKFASSTTCRLDTAVFHRNMPISTAYWLSAVTAEVDDWSSVLQEQNTLWTSGYGQVFFAKRSQVQLYSKEL